MKNYKHSVKSGNAMKLAAVASAAIMMAPVALNSVSTFAGTTSNTPAAGFDSQGRLVKTLADLKSTLTKTEANYAKLTDTQKKALASTLSRYDEFTKMAENANSDSDQILVDKAYEKLSAMNGAMQVALLKAVNTDNTAVAAKATLTNRIAKYTAAGKTSYLPAIRAAKKVLNNSANSAKEFAQAAVDLDAAIAKIDGANVNVDETAAAAKATLTNRIAKYTAAGKTSYLPAIRAAKKVLNNSASSAKEFAQAAVDLDAAIAKIDGANVNVDETAAAAKKTLHSHINIAKNLSVQNGLTSAQRNSLLSAIKVAEKAEAQYTNAKQFSDATLLLDAVVKSVKEDIANNGSTDKPSTNADKDKAYADLKNAMNTLNGFSDGFLATFAGQNFKAALQGQADALAAGTVSYKQISINILKAVDEATKANAKYEANNNDNNDNDANNSVATAKKVAYDTLNAAVKKYAGFGDAFKATESGKLFAATIQKMADQLATAKTAGDFTAVTDRLQSAMDIVDAGLKNFNNKQNNRFTGIAHINYAKGYGIQVWTKDHKIVRNADGSAKKLGGETNWKVFGPSVNINGKNMYCVGGNQYVDAAYVTFTHSVNLNK